MTNAPLNYDYTFSRAYCTQLGLFWLGDDFVREADVEAKQLNFTQTQVDAAMKHHLAQVAFLFTPKSYPAWSRFKIALCFLTGIGAPKSK